MKSAITKILFITGIIGLCLLCADSDNDKIFILTKQFGLLLLLGPIGLGCLLNRGGDKGRG